MPFNINFTKTFKHQPWVDARDRVTAGGDNGFNVRFQALEADLDTLEDRFQQVSAALNAVAAGGGGDRVITVPPLFVTTSGAPWDLSNVGTAHTLAGADASGAVQVQLPAAGVVSSLTVTGRTIGPGVLQVTLYRIDARGAQSSIVVARVDGQAGEIPFTVTRSANGHRIDPASSYFIYADGQSGSTTSSIQINSLQVACAAG
ncbi:hypothetical protein [Nocardia iowensis]|uniref:Uncharacterized protein n=1 Tax=Nocardia iowensis TaxID=204891 RepID=A0ABX8RF92_NOCIO|nr:hypothetical protein [Nocardia iowensis]QXN88274.1 hypothetical protein KV110_21970 [Nocardia iowensis]